MAGPATKYDFSGIGAAEAKLLLAALLANPSTSWLATGLVGTFMQWLLTRVFSMGASVGLVLLNLGAEKVEGMVDQHNFDGSFDSAEKILEAARDAHQTLTPAQIQAIDAPVINSFRKWASFARQKQ